MISALTLVAALAAIGPPGSPAFSDHRVASARADTLSELHAGVGEGPHARLRFFFEVTFMKIDIAWVEAYLDSATASVVEQAAPLGYSKGRARALEMALLDGNPMLLRMELARGGGAGRFLGATRDNLRAAVECGAMSQPVFDALWPAMDEALAPVEKRGMEKGDAIHYRIDGERIRIVYLGPSGEVIVDETYLGAGAARGLVGSFICRESSFGEDLVRSAWDSGP